MNDTVSLNGIWRLDGLSDAPYTSENEPLIRPNSDSAVDCPVPGYWEDMTDLFRTTVCTTGIAVSLYSEWCRDSRTPAS